MINLLTALTLILFCHYLMFRYWQRAFDAEDRKAQAQEKECENENENEFNMMP